MKVSSSILFVLSGAAALANPVAEPEPKPAKAPASCSPLNAILPSTQIPTLNNLLDIFITPASPLGLGQGPVTKNTRWPLVIADEPNLSTMGFFYNLTLGKPGSENKASFRHGAFNLDNNQLFANGGALGIYSGGNGGGGGGGGGNPNPLQPAQLYISLDTAGSMKAVSAVMYCNADGKAVPVLTFPVATLNQGSMLTQGAPKTGSAVFAPSVALGLGGTPVIAEIVEVQ